MQATVLAQCQEKPDHYRARKAAATGRLPLIAHHLTQDVFDFLIERDDRVFFRSLLTGLGKCKSEMPLGLFNIIATSHIIREIAIQRTRAFFSTLDAAIIVAAALSDKDAPTRDALRKLGGLITDKAEQKPVVILSSILLLLVFGAHNKIEPRLLMPTIVYLLFSRAAYDLQKLANEFERRTRGDLFRDILFACVSAEIGRDSKLTMTLDVSELCERISEIANFPIPVAGIESSLPASYKASFSTFFADVPSALHGKIRKFYRKDAAIAQKIEK